jgi:hypothetical protein
MSGGAFTDSYDSSAGTYASTALASKGDVGTNGNLTVNGATTIINGGSASFGVGAVTSGFCPNTFTNNSGARAVQSTIALGRPQTLTSPVYTNPSPALTTTSTWSTNQNLTPGNYNNIKMTAAKTLTLAPGTYNFNSLTLIGNSSITVSPAGPVVINVAGAGSPLHAIDLTGGNIVNASGTPANFLFFHNGAVPITLSGGASSASVLYAPSAPVTIVGGTPWYGAIVGSTLTDLGGSAIHFDRALPRNFQNLGLAHALSFSWSKF